MKSSRIEYHIGGFNLKLKNKVVIVTGGAGFIGSHLVDAMLNEEPEKVIVLDNLFLGKLENLQNAFASHENLELEMLDITDYELLSDIFDRENVDVVFNLAITPLPVCLKKPKWSWDKNINMTANICELARFDKFKTLIHTSSSEAYGTLLTDPMPECHPLYPHTPYAASKAATDHLVFSYDKTFGIEQSIIRPFNNYGPRQNEKYFAGVIPLTIKRILKGEKPIIFGDGMQTRDFIYVTDTARAFIDIYEHKNTRGMLINIASGEEISIKTYILEIAKHLKYSGEIDYKEARKGDVRRHKGDIRLALDLIGFKTSVGIGEGIKNTVEWYLEYFEKNKGSL